jgi:hypothetical protein
MAQSGYPTIGSSISVSIHRLLLRTTVRFSEVPLRAVWFIDITVSVLQKSKRLQADIRPIVCSCFFLASHLAQCNWSKSRVTLLLERK